MDNRVGAFTTNLNHPPPHSRTDELVKTSSQRSNLLSKVVVCIILVNVRNGPCRQDVNELAASLSYACRGTDQHLWLGGHRGASHMGIRHMSERPATTWHFNHGQMIMFPHASRKMEALKAAIHA
jgi:hypothetical protein